MLKNWKKYYPGEKVGSVQKLGWHGSGFFYELEGFIHIAQYWLHPGTIRVLLNTHNCFYYNQTKVKVS